MSWAWRPTDAGVCFMAEGLRQIYGIEPLQASQLVSHLLPYAFEYLNRGIVERLAATEGVTAEQAATMLADARAKLELERFPFDLGHRPYPACRK
jgi:hypothetical protein